MAVCVYMYFDLLKSVTIQIKRFLGFHNLLKSMLMSTQHKLFIKYENLKIKESVKKYMCNSKCVLFFIEKTYLPF